LISDYKKYLDPSIISKLANLELKAKFVVEGFIAGLHKSPFHGFSVEFAEHRQYMPGDDLKYLDWKILGRTDRYYIKQFEEETNLKSYIIVDSSKSMSFSSSSPQYSSFFPLKKLFRKKTEYKNVNSTIGISKLEYATYLAASISALMNFQKDAVGLVVYDENIKTYIPPKATNQNLRLVLSSLSKIESSGKTNTAAALDSIAERIKRRGLVIIFSDLFDDQEAVINSLKHFRYKKNEVIVFQILDALEMNFAIDSPTIFKDLETNKEMLSQPISFMQAYRDAVREFIDKYKKACRMNNIDYALLSTSTPFDVALLEYLNKRKLLN
jgi:uncharacterized protein (DUF58 family)